MATQTLGLIVLAQEYRGDVVRQINRRVTALKLLRIVPGGGLNVAWAPEADGAIAENHTEGADAANYGSDAQTSAVLPWALYRSNFQVTKTAMDAAASSSTPLGNRMLWARNLMNATAKLADKVEKEIFTGLGTGTLMAGFDVAIGDNANTYATIARAGNSYWRPTVVDPGSSTSVSMALIRDDIRQIYVAGGENPDLCLCGPATFNAVAGLFDANRRWTQVNTARGTVKLDAGYEGVEVDGCMFVKAKDATEGNLYYLNSNHVELQYLPDSSVPREISERVTGDDGYGSTPLGFTYEMLAKTGPSSKAQVLSTIQLKVERPNTCGVRKNVNFSVA